MREKDRQQDLCHHLQLQQTPWTQLHLKIEAHAHLDGVTAGKHVAQGVGRINLYTPFLSNIHNFCNCFRTKLSRNRIRYN
jgi:hypothetical protein